MLASFWRRKRSALNHHFCRRATSEQSALNLLGVIVMAVHDVESDVGGQSLDRATPANASVAGAGDKAERRMRAGLDDRPALTAADSVCAFNHSMQSNGNV